MIPTLVVPVVAIYTAEAVALETEKEPDWEMCRKLLL